MFPFLAVTLLLLQGTVSFKVPGPHLADVSVLLPPKMTHPVEYRLQGVDGCFEWSWDDHDLLDVLPEYSSSKRCSTSARLRSIAPYNGRKRTIVYASDVSTGIVIRCKVFIDNLFRIQIFHTYIELELDEIAILRVRAFDKEGNVFTSLAGLQFVWELGNHLVHVPLKDSPLSDNDVQTNLENNGVYSDLYIVKGVRIGHENVSVHLHEHHWKDLADKIVLDVVEATSLHSPTNRSDQDTTMLDLTLDDNTSFITLVVNTGDQVHFDGRGSIKANPINKEDSGIGGCVVFEIQAKDTGLIIVKHNLLESRVPLFCTVILLKPTRFSEKTIITLTTNERRVKVEAGFKFEERHEPPNAARLEVLQLNALFAMLALVSIIFVIMWLTPRSPPVPALFHNG